MQDEQEKSLSSRLSQTKLCKNTVRFDEPDAGADSAIVHSGVYVDKELMRQAWGELPKEVEITIRKIR